MTHSEGRHADEHPMVLEFGTEQTEAAGDWLARVFRALHETGGPVACGIAGHSMLIHYAPARLSLAAVHDHLRI
jgi:hypothetical protein